MSIHAGHGMKCDGKEFYRYNAVPCLVIVVVDPDITKVTHPTPIRNLQQRNPEKEKKKLPFLRLNLTGSTSAGKITLPSCYLPNPSFCFLVYSAPNVLPCRQIRLAVVPEL